MKQIYDLTNTTQLLEALKQHETLTMDYICTPHLAFAIDYVSTVVAVEVEFGISKVIKGEPFLMNLPNPIGSQYHPILKQTRINNDHLYSKSG